MNEEMKYIWRYFKVFSALTLTLLFLLTATIFMSLEYETHEIQTTTYNDTQDGLLINNELVKGEIIGYDNGTLTYETSQFNEYMGGIILGMFVGLVASAIAMIICFIKLGLAHSDAIPEGNIKIKPVNKTKHKIFLFSFVILLIISLSILFFGITLYPENQIAYPQDYSFNDGTLILDGDVLDNSILVKSDGTNLEYKTGVPSELVSFGVALSPILMIVSLLGINVNVVQLIDEREGDASV